MTSSKYIILGGGMVAGYAAKELASRVLRSGELMIISADDALPYERPPLCKGFLSGKDTEDGILIMSEKATTREFTYSVARIESSGRIHQLRNGVD